MNRDLNNLLLALGNDMGRPDFWWQIAVLLLCIGLAVLIDRQMRKRAADLGERGLRLGEGGLKRLVFPVSAVVLILLARGLLRPHPVNLLSIALPLMGSLAVIRLVFFVLRFSFASATWLATFERLFASIAWSVVAMHIVGWLPDVVNFLDTTGFHVGKQWISLLLLIQGGVTVFFSLLLALWLGGAVDVRLAQAQGLDGNLRLVFSRLSKTLLLLVAVLVSLPMVGIDLTTLSVFGGALGVGLGLGLQKVAANYVSGFIILLDRSIRIGNIISVGVDRGEVTRITTRYTVLKSLTGVESIVPNELLMGSVVQNESLSDRRVRIPIPVQVAYNSDLDLCLELLVSAARTESRVMADPPPLGLVTAFADSGINLELGFWINDPEQGTGLLKSNIHRAIWRAFKQHGIEIPFPQREVRLLGNPAQ